MVSHLLSFLNPDYLASVFFSEQEPQETTPALKAEAEFIIAKQRSLIFGDVNDGIDYEFERKEEDKKQREEFVKRSVSDNKPKAPIRINKFRRALRQTNFDFMPVYRDIPADSSYHRATKEVAAYRERIGNEIAQLKQKRFRLQRNVTILNPIAEESLIEGPTEKHSSDQSTDEPLSPTDVDHFEYSDSIISQDKSKEIYRRSQLRVSTSNNFHSKRRQAQILTDKPFEAIGTA